MTYGMGLWTRERYVVWSLVVVRMAPIDSYRYTSHNPNVSIYIVRLFVKGSALITLLLKMLQNIFVG